MQPANIKYCMRCIPQPPISCYFPVDNSEWDLRTRVKVTQKHVNLKLAIETCRQ